MEVKENQIFNLWDTNGRRKDILNALQIYLNILRDIQEKNPNEKWANYPESFSQYLFYKAAIEASPEIFQKHPKFDKFEEEKRSFQTAFNHKKWERKNEIGKKLLDEGIEERARHYTSNLVRIGFADEERKITSVGKDFLLGKVSRDPFEQLLPISDINLILLRQLLKLRIYSKEDENGNRKFFSPCKMAFYLLLNNIAIDKESFKQRVQGILLQWWNGNSEIEFLEKILQAKDFAEKNIIYPEIFLQNEKINKESFEQNIKNQKSSEAVSSFYQFYSALFEYASSPSVHKYSTIRKILNSPDSQKIHKAFGCGEKVLDTGAASKPYDYNTFVERNRNSLLLKGNFNKNFYKAYYLSKYIDDVNEYSDTTFRMLSATGVFKFDKALPEINYKSAFNKLFEKNRLKNEIFGHVSKEEFNQLENGTNALYHQNISTLQILGIKATQATFNQINPSSLRKESQSEFEKHIENKYSKEKTLEILKLFSNRKNDSKIKKAVNEDASVPTIYEYMVAIAWYYISGKKISVYDSLNLTLNGDMEPVIHAAGGAGDIVVNYSNRIVMLEVTLMNAASQKRGEWEPVLRHTVNLNTENENKKVITLFIADELDYNTINIWRAVSAVPLQASNSDKKTDKVVISAFKNEELCNFLENGISDTKILSAIENSYSMIQSNFDTNWRGNMLNDIQASYKV